MQLDNNCTHSTRQSKQSIKMAPTNLNRKRTYAQLVRARPVAPVRPVVHARPVVHRWFKYFDDVEFDDCRINRAFSVIVKVDVKFHPEAYGDIQRFILMDATGSKMEAIVSGENAARFTNILIVGQKYTIHGVYFKPNSWEINFRAIKRDYDCFFTRTTIIESYNLPLQFPLYPKQLTKFSDLSLPEHRNKTFVDIAGIIVYLGPLQRVSNRLYREVTLLDTRCDLVVIGTI
uniref:Replication protein A 70 kDa DNA-binding subunit B/D first OB fold domain-containing protein n=3 Tax=Oryza punctata TaxID=4537 RepID=A0A0E0JGM3_ORYPU